jgi:hypothetical protein
MAAGLLLCGCSPPRAPAPPPAPTPPRPDTLPIQQSRVYSEAVTGLFVSLADFEDSPAGLRGHQQVKYFSFDPPPDAAARYRRPTSVPATDSAPSSEPAAAPDQLAFVVNVTRTGAGAMDVTLSPRRDLVFAIPEVHDFSRYSLLSLALYSPSLRDDLQVTLVSEEANWVSPRTLLRPGWNTVQMDIQRLSALPGFDTRKVRQLRLAFPSAGAPVKFTLDDILLIQNTRPIGGAPAGMTVTKSGLDYSIQLPGDGPKLTLAQSDDGLWRLGDNGAILQLLGAGQKARGDGEELELMGRRRVGQVELLECNSLRVRLANTWYFPSRSGEWVSSAVRQVRWEYTFYGDGRWVTGLEINNSGGADIASLRILLPTEAGWSDGRVGKELRAQNLISPVYKAAFLIPLPADAEESIATYCHPLAVRPLTDSASPAKPGAPSIFDAAQGCYCLKSSNGHCRFVVPPSHPAAPHPVFRIAGPWRKGVTVNCAGQAVRQVVGLEDGSILLAIPALPSAPVAVEVTDRFAMPDPAEKEANP